MSTQKPTYQFGPIEIETEAFRLLKDGTPVAVEPKAFFVLLYFVENPGRLITKNELLDAVWKETAVTENALTRIIAQLRKALGDDAKVARYIETVPTQGYRFVASVTKFASESSQAPETEQNLTDREIQTTSAEAFRVPVAQANPFAGNPTPSRPVWKTTMALVALGFLLAVGLLGMSLTKRPTTVSGNFPSTVSRVSQVTVSVGLDMFPSFSPDGNSIVYSSDKTGTFEIYLRQLTLNGSEIQLTNDQAANFQPAWSPDGSEIAFFSKKKGGIWVIPALGGTPRQLTTFGSHPAWSNDSQHIAFQSDGLADWSQTAYEALSPSTLWLVPAKGGTPRQLTQPGMLEGGHGSPSWSPDNRLIVFTNQDPNLSEIAVYDFQTNQTKLVLKERQPYYNPIFSRDGTSLFFATYQDNFRIWQLPVNAAGEAQGQPVEIANTAGSLAKHLALSPDGKRLACSMQSLSSNLYTVPISPLTGEPTGPPRPLTQDSLRRKTIPVFSPDGNQLIYRTQRTGDFGEPWIVNADGSQAKPLGADIIGVFGWFPDGRLAALRREGNAPLLVAYDLKTGKESRLEKQMTDARNALRLFLNNGLGIGFVRLSPDGKKLVFNSRRGGAINLWLVDTESNSLKQLTFDKELMGFPTWSPDGKEIAFEMRRGENTFLATMAVPDGPIQQVNHEPGQTWTGGWSPDGAKISAALFRNGFWNISWFSRDGNTQKQLTHFTQPNGFVRVPVWSPKGDQIVFEYGLTTGNILIYDIGANTSDDPTTFRKSLK
ncbi:MAG: winged helix-turn-helix domain-containing protein [Blastocatellia bacterium]|nr:winged helix-turn-helix domain-containing protein [Blastocatellia bacterium]